MLGYVAEILLKCAYFEFDGLNREDDPKVRGYITWPNLRTLISQHGITYDGTRYYRTGLAHSPKFWAEVLIDRREQEGKPLSPAVSGALIKSVMDIEDNRNVTMRYLPDLALPGEAVTVFESTLWILDRYDDLKWR
jgi:hypothetical protein